jgi:hypothetical protein
MADNTGYTPGSGVKIASRGVNYSGEPVQAQSVGLLTFSGADDAKEVEDVSPTAPLPVAVYGELVEAIESMRMAVNALTKTIGFALPNALGQPVMEARQLNAGNLNANVTTLTNQTQIGGFAANDQVPALMHLQADSLRRNIGVT